MRFDLSTVKGRIGGILWAMVVEHNIVNLFRDNFYRISPNAFRSAQPTPWQIRRRVKQYGIKTIINVRGFAKDSPLRDLEIG